MSTDAKGLGAGDIPEIAFGIVAIIVAILSFMKGWLFLRNRRFTVSNLYASLQLLRLIIGLFKEFQPPCHNNLYIS